MDSKFSKAILRLVKSSGLDLDSNSIIKFNSQRKCYSVYLRGSIDQFLIKSDEFRAEIEYPYLNLYFSDNTIVDLISESEKEYLAEVKSHLLEHTSANPTGILHAGNYLNPLWGEYTKRFSQINGYKVKTLYYLNDAGNAVIKHLIKVLFHEGFDLDLFKSNFCELAFLNELNRIQESRLYVVDRQPVQLPEGFDEEMAINQISQMLNSNAKTIEGEIVKTILRRVIDLRTKSWTSTISTELSAEGITFNRFVLESELKKALDDDFAYLILSLMIKVDSNLICTDFNKKATAVGLKWDLSNDDLFKFKEIIKSLNSGLRLRTNRQNEEFLIKSNGIKTYLFSDILFCILKMVSADSTTIFGSDHRRHAASLIWICSKIKKELSQSNKILKEFKKLSCSLGISEMIEDEKLYNFGIILTPLLKLNDKKMSKRRSNIRYPLEFGSFSEFKLMSYYSVEENCADEIKIEKLDIKNSKIIQSLSSLNKIILPYLHKQTPAEFFKYIEPIRLITPHPESFLKRIDKLAELVETTGYLTPLIHKIISDVLKLFEALYGIELSSLAS